jgi:hypothetical protein
MPTWCTFRDAARKEQVAVETAAVAAALPPQAPRFQNSPLKVFGDHDEGTLAQMRNCLGVGNVVAGVICADGHLGYAQPVGGVIAYEGQISISGVGFDIGCGNVAVQLDTPFAAIRGPHRADHQGRGADHFIRGWPHQRGEGRARAVRRYRGLEGVRHGRVPAEGRRPARHRRFGESLRRPDARPGWLLRDGRRHRNRAKAADMLVADLARSPPGLDEAYLQPGGGLTEPDEHDGALW